jgi:hypothetical protein
VNIVVEFTLKLSIGYLFKQNICDISEIKNSERSYSVKYFFSSKITSVIVINIQWKIIYYQYTILVMELNMCPDLKAIFRFCVYLPALRRWPS